MAKKLKIAHNKSNECWRYFVANVCNAWFCYFGRNFEYGLV